MTRLRPKGFAAAGRRQRTLLRLIGFAGQAEDRGQQAEDR